MLISFFEFFLGEVSLPEGSVYGLHIRVARGKSLKLEARAR